MLPLPYPPPGWLCHPRTGLRPFLLAPPFHFSWIRPCKTESERVRNYLFATFSFSINLGFILGPGKRFVLAGFNIHNVCAGFAVIVAQFESVDQFRAMGWFNFAYGVVVLCVLVILFQGEMSFKTDRLSYCQVKKKNSSCRMQNMSLLSLFISFRIRKYNYL